MGPSRTRKPQVVVVMPAYNAAKTLERTYRDIPLDVVDEVILVDDVSADETVEIAERLRLDVIMHIQNKGYGGNQKTCYVEALKRGADVVVMLHPDYQFDSTLITQLIAPILGGEVELMLGSRLLDGGDRTLAGGMPFWKYVSNRFLTLCENQVLHQHLSECHTGFRAYSRKLLETIPFLLNSDDLVFDSQVIVQAVALGFRVGEIAVPTRYFREASSVNLRRSIMYGLETLNTLRIYMLDQAHIAPSPLLRQSLQQVLPRYYHSRILREPGIVSNR